MKLSGNEYAKVPTRVKAFREDSPNGWIETLPTFLENGMVMFRTVVVKDKSDANSAQSSGTSLGPVMKDGKEIPKAFEKLETISVGRALANLGYLISGEIASSEEMEDFLTSKEAKRLDKIEWVKERVAEITTIPELKKFYEENKGLGQEAIVAITERSKQIKAEGAVKAKV